MYLSLEKTVRSSAWLACAMVVGMIAIFFATGVGQDPLQFVHPPDEYARLLLEEPGGAAACLGLDNVFIVFYSTLFVALGVLLVRGGAERALVRWRSACSLAARAARHRSRTSTSWSCSRAPSRGCCRRRRDRARRCFESLLKFHVSYLGLFLLGFALPRRTAGERALAGLSWFVQLPVGVLIYVTPRGGVVAAGVRALHLLRRGAVLLVASRFGADARAAGSGARASRRDTTPGVAG